MECFKVAVLLIAVCAPMALGCSQQAVMKCVTDNQELSTLMATATQDPKAAEKACGLLTGLQSCITEATSTCTADQKKAFAQVTSGFDMLTGMCDKNSPCNVAKLGECTKGLPMSEAAAQNVDYKQLCKDLPKMQKCFKEMQTGCQNPQMNSMLQQISQGIPNADKECKKMYGDDYASKQGGTDGAGDGDGNSGHVLQYSILASMLTVIVSVFLK